MPHNYDPKTSSCAGPNKLEESRALGNTYWMKHGLYELATPCYKCYKRHAQDETRALDNTRWMKPELDDTRAGRNTCRMKHVVYKTRAG